MTGRKARSGRPPDLRLSPGNKGRLDAVIRALPGGDTEIRSAELIERIQRYAGSKATAIRWLKEAEKRGVVQCRQEGRYRFYSFSISGFLTGPFVEQFMSGVPFEFLRAVPEISEEYRESVADMTRFWQQASAALTMSIESLLNMAQSMQFSQVQARATPSEKSVRRQADVLTEYFVRRWMQDLVVAFYRFLKHEQLRNQSTPRLSDGKLGAPSAVEGFRDGWAWATGLEGAAHKTWVPLMKGEEAGPWGRYVERKQAELEAETRALSREEPPQLKTPSDTA